MAYDQNGNPIPNPNGIGSDANIPLGGWSNSMPPTGFNPPAAGAGIGGDWRFPVQNTDMRTLPAPAAAMHPRVLRGGSPSGYSAFGRANGFTDNFTPSLDGVDLRGSPTGPSGPVPNTPVQGNPFFNFLSALFGHSGGSPPQGMTGMLQARGQSARGTDSLGNPVNRF